MKKNYFLISLMLLTLSISACSSGNNNNPEDKKDPDEGEIIDPTPVPTIEPTPVEPTPTPEPTPIEPIPEPTPIPAPTPDPGDEDEDFGSVDNPYTVAKVIEVAKELSADESTPIKYFIKGYVTGSINTNGFASYGELTFNIKDKDKTPTFYCYQVLYLNKDKFPSVDTLKEGDEVVVFTSIVNFRGNTPETESKGNAYLYSHNDKKSSSIPEQGFPEEDPNAKACTISALINDNSSYTSEGANNKKLYRITGIAQHPSNITYGNFDLLDSTGYIYVHGCTRSKQSLVNDGENGLIINNDKSFKSIGIVPGDEVTIEGWYSYHKYTTKYGIPQFTGYVTKLVKKNAYDTSTASYTEKETYEGNYYDSITETSGNLLLTQLHNLMDSTHTTYISYNSLENHYYKADDDMCFYSNTSVSNGNKEHVWPQSLSGSSQSQLYGEDHGGSDFHHVRWAIGTYNSRRSNAMFGKIYGDGKCSTIAYTGSNNNKYTTNVFEPSDAIKGDVARIIAYMYMHYSSSSYVGLTNWVDRNYYSEMHLNWVMGPNTFNETVRLLRKWNAMDPVSELEIKRNEYGYKVQGNRNPFIDHPSYMDMIWG